MRHASAAQSGHGVLGNLFWLLVMGFFLLLGIRLFPVYYDYFAIKASMNDVAKSSDLHGKGRRQIWDRLYKHLTVNDIDYLDERDLKIRRTQQGTEMTLDYEVRRPFLANVDLVVHFRHSAILR